MSDEYRHVYNGWFVLGITTLISITISWCVWDIFEIKIDKLEHELLKLESKLEVLEKVCVNN